MCFVSTHAYVHSTLHANQNQTYSISVEKGSSQACSSKTVNIPCFMASSENVAWN